MPLPLARIGREIGVVLSGSSAAYASVALRRDAETEVREEDIVVIVDERVRGYYMLGVLRNVVRYEPFLRRGLHNVYVEAPEALRSELVMPFTNAVVEIYGGLCDEEALDLCGGSRFTSNTYAPTPSSRVYKLVDASSLTSYLDVALPITVGSHSRSGWRLPLDASYAPYHIGVFGATGMGKSRLVAKLAYELSKAGYGIVIFDHSGQDYVGFARGANLPVIDANDVRIPANVFASTVAEIMGVSGQHRDFIEVVAMCFALKVYGTPSSECEQVLGWRRSRGNPKEEFIEAIENGARAFNLRGVTVRKLKLIASITLPTRLFETLVSRSVEPREIVETARRSGIVVVDLSTEQDIEVKRAIVSSVTEAAWSVVREEGRPVNIGIAVDEAQNYACDYCGSSAKALETVAREGRKWGLFLIVASQRVARDIRPGIRSNLGTVFFSKLQASGDLQEIAGYLDLGGVSEASLAMLRRREFYVAGLMNPLRRPMLLTVDEVKGFPAS